MSDILVQKYQHYFNESVKLQETVNEQAAYIQELEEALISLDEKINLRNIALSTALGAGIMGGAGVVGPYVSDAKIEGLKAIEDPAGISSVEQARKGVRKAVGLDTETPATTRFGLGAAVGGALGAAASLVGGKPKRR